MSKVQTETVVALFDDSDTAGSAVSQVNKVLSLTHRELRKGALITRNAEDEVSIKDLKYTGVRDIVGSTADLIFFLGKGTVKIVMGTAKDGASLLFDSTGRMLGLAGSVASLPMKKIKSWATSPSGVDAIGDQLGVGMSALAIEVNSASAGAVRDTLEAAGGVVTEMSHAPAEG